MNWNKALTLLRENKSISQLIDVTFVIEDKHIKAHRLVLAVQSPVFSTMFEQTQLLGYDRDSNTGQYLIEIKDIFCSRI